MICHAMAEMAVSTTIKSGSLASSKSSNPRAWIAPNDLQIRNYLKGTASQAAEKSRLA
jgi:hypothetical protein